MLRSYATGCTWPLDGGEDLVSAARRAEGVARALGWTSEEATALSQVILELGGNAVRHGGGGTCRLEAGAEGADVIVEDRGPGFPEWVLHGDTHSGRPGATSRGLDSVRKLSAQLVLENLPAGGGRARAALTAHRAHEVLAPSRPRALRPVVS